MVYCVAKRFRETEGSEDVENAANRKFHGSARPVRAKRVIKRAQKLIQKDPGTPLTTLGSKLKVSSKKLRHIASEDLRYKSYMLKIGQMLSEDARNKRVVKGSLLLSSMHPETPWCIRFFSDEKFFTLEEFLNRRNNTWLAQEPEDMPVVLRTKFSASVHVLGVVWSEGDVMPPHFLTKGQTVTKEVYLDVLQKKFHPWVNKVTDGKPYVFQQDGAPAHNSHLVQNWLNDKMDHYWSKGF
jgi:hypothetical protein